MTENKLFYFTHSQKEIFKEYCNIKNTDRETVLIEYLEKNPDINDKNKKANTENLIKYLFVNRFPVYSKIKEAFEKITRNTKNSKIQISTHEIFEDPSIKLEIKIENYKEFIDTIELLNHKKELVKDYFRILHDEDIL